MPRLPTASQEESSPIDAFNVHILRTYSETNADGEGLRYSIYLAGCAHQCPGCHNPSSWSGTAGELLNETRLHDIIAEINANHLLDGITISGGDPFYNPSGLVVLLKRLKRDAKPNNIWCYTGYTIESILKAPTLAQALPYIDVLVDGPFILSQRDPTLKFCGSSNQRIIEDPKNWGVNR